MDKSVKNGDVGQRLLAIRTYVGVNQRDFASMVQISQSFVSDVERGKSKGSIDLLTGISVALPDISIRWLLTGEGAMLVTGETSALQGPGSSMGGQGIPAVDPLVAELEELRGIAEAGGWSRLRVILMPLMDSPSPLIRSDLARLCKTTPEAIQSDIAMLRRMGLIVETQEGISATGDTIRLGSTADGSRLALDATRVLLQKVLPAADRRDGTGRLVYSEVDVKDSRALLMELLRETKAIVERQPKGSERVTLVFGVHAEDSSDDDDH